MNFDYENFKIANDLAHWVALIGLGVWGYLRTKDSDNASAVKSVAAELATFIKASGLANEDLKNRLTIAEEAIKHMPTDHEVQRIASDVSSIKARQEGQAELLKRVEHQTNLIHEHLLKTSR